jgi:hypothetical protein
LQCMWWYIIITNEQYLEFALYTLIEKEIFKFIWNHIFKLNILLGYHAMLIPKICSEHEYILYILDCGSYLGTRTICNHDYKNGHY